MYWLGAQLLNCSRLLVAGCDQWAVPMSVKGSCHSLSAPTCDVEGPPPPCAGGPLEHKTGNHQRWCIADSQCYSTQSVLHPVHNLVFILALCGTPGIGSLEIQATYMSAWTLQMITDLNTVLDALPICLRSTIDWNPMC